MEKKKECNNGDTAVLEISVDKPGRKIEFISSDEIKLPTWVEIWRKFGTRDHFFDPRDLDEVSVVVNSGLGDVPEVSLYLGHMSSQEAKSRAKNLAYRFDSLRLLVKTKIKDPQTGILKKKVLVINEYGVNGRNEKMYNV